jgi:hypothetical protein
MGLGTLGLGIRVGRRNWLIVAWPYLNEYTPCSHLEPSGGIGVTY